MRERETACKAVCVLGCGENGCVYVYSIEVSICYICVCEHIRSTHCVYLGVDVCVWALISVYLWMCILFIGVCMGGVVSGYMCTVLIYVYLYVIYGCACIV